MENNIQFALAEQIKGFHLPRYAELPDVGLYLEQTVKYINHSFAPLGCIEITSSMVRNYVKQGFIRNPVHKQYSKDQIGYLICITILKHAVPLEHVSKLFARQKTAYANEVAYDYFCMELENILYCCFGLKDSMDAVGVTSSIEKEMLRSAITAVSHMIYLNACFARLSQE